MLTLKHNGMVVVLEYNANEKSDAEKLDRLKEIYGHDRIIHRNYMIKKYEVMHYNQDTKEYETKEVKIPYFNETGLNRSEKRRAEKIAANPFYGVTRPNSQHRTKHKRTAAEIARERRARKKKV